MQWRILCLLSGLCAASGLSQNAAFPLESVAIEGSTIPEPEILQIAGLHIGSPIDKPGIEQACAKLQESGLFSTISYHYGPGPKKGYVLTLTLADQERLTVASIDVPGVETNETWKWLLARFRRFDHEVPQVEPAQKYLAGEIERHLGPALRGQHLTVRMETDLKTGKLTLSFQPEVLPKIQSIAFVGNQAIASDELGAVLNRAVANAEYTDRRFATAVELNLRPVYEEHGYYRVQFTPGNPRWTDSGVVLSVAINEGASYQLGKVEIAGDDLPVDAMMAAAKLPNGKPANWRTIQEGIWEMEKVIKRRGFFEATASPDRSYDDAAHVLNLRIRMNNGPLYHFGELTIAGLSPDLECRARRLWKHKPGDLYDYAYSAEFLQALSRSVNLRNFGKFQAVAKAGAGDHVVDTNLIFEPR